MNNRKRDRLGDPRDYQRDEDFLESCHFIFCERHKSDTIEALARLVVPPCGVTLFVLVGSALLDSLDSIYQGPLRAGSVEHRVAVKPRENPIFRFHDYSPSSVICTYSVGGFRTKASPTQAFHGVEGGESHTKSRFSKHYGAVKAQLHDASTDNGLGLCTCPSLLMRRFN